MHWLKFEEYPLWIPRMSLLLYFSFPANSSCFSLLRPLSLSLQLWKVPGSAWVPLSVLTQWDGRAITGISLLLSGQFESPWFCLSLQQKFEATDGLMLQPSKGPVLQLCVTDQFYLESKGKHVQGMRACWSKRPKEKRGTQSNFLAPIFMFFCILPWTCLCKLG